MFTMNIKPGMRFRSKNQLDTSWVPGPGQKYKDGPKQVMVITSVIGKIFYFRPDDGESKGLWYSDTTVMDKTVGEWL